MKKRILTEKSHLVNSDNIIGEYAKFQNGMKSKFKRELYLSSKSALN